MEADQHRVWNILFMRYLGWPCDVIVHLNPYNSFGGICAIMHST